MCFEQLRWGGQRRGAGRKKSGRAGLPHAARERYKKYLPELVTLKLMEGFPSLRQTEEWVVMRGVFESMKALEDFRITYFSLMSSHVHMIVEADSHEASRGMRSFVSRMSKRLVALWGRTGQGLAPGRREPERAKTGPARRSLAPITVAPSASAPLGRRGDGDGSEGADPAPRSGATERLDGGRAAGQGTACSATSA